jgi:hypothetical protein
MCVSVCVWNMWPASQDLVNELFLTWHPGVVELTKNGWQLAQMGTQVRAFSIVRLTIFCKLLASVLTSCSLQGNVFSQVIVMCVPVAWLVRVAKIYTYIKKYIYMYLLKQCFKKTKHDPPAPAPRLIRPT